MGKFKIQNDTDKVLPLVADLLYRMTDESRNDVTSPTSPPGRIRRVLHWCFPPEGVCRILGCQVDIRVFYCEGDFHNLVCFLRLSSNFRYFSSTFGLTKLNSGNGNKFGGVACAR